MKCSRIPFLYVTKDNTIQIKCLCQNRIIKLEDYIHQLKIFNKTIKTHISYCEEVLSHCNNKSKGYCVLCQKYLCKQCINQHKKIGHSYSSLPFQMNITSHSKNNLDYIFFCKDCHKTIPNQKDEMLHYSHESIKSFEFKDKEPTKGIMQFNTISHTYKQMLKKVLNNAIRQKHLEKDILNKSYKECIKRNKVLILLIHILIKNYQKIQFNEYTLLSNLFIHTVFTPLYPNKVNDHITFFTQFTIIKINPVLEEFKEKKVLNTSIYSINKKFKIIVLTVINEQLILLGDVNGNVFLFNTNNKDMNYIKAHFYAITDLLLLPNSHIFSSSLDFNLHYLKVNQKDSTLSIIHTFDLGCEPIVHSINLPSKRIASIAGNGTMVIWNYDDYEDVIVDMSLFRYCHYSYGCLAYSEKYKTIVKLLNGNIYFVSLEPFKRKKEKICNIHVKTKSSVHISKEHKLLVGGIRKDNNDNDIANYFFIINIEKRQIETILDGHTNIKMTKSINRLFIFEYNESYLFYTNEGWFALYDKKTLQIIKIFIVKKSKHKIYTTVLLSQNKYISLYAKNKIKINSLNVLDSQVKNNIVVVKRKKNSTIRKTLSEQKFEEYMNFLDEWNRSFYIGNLLH